MKNLPAKQIQPYPQEVLNWDDGLTSRDLSDVLGIPLRSVHQKIERTNWLLQEEIRPIPNVFSNVSNGVETKIYVFTKIAAKCFVARYNNLVGKNYLYFLLKCEEIVLEKVPELLDIIKQQRETILLFEDNTAKKKRGYRVLIGKKAVNVKTLFGDEIVVEEIRKEIDFLTETEKEAYNYLRRASTSTKLINENQKQLDKGEVSPVVPNRKLLERDNDD